MNIEAGKFYKARDGRKVGPMVSAVAGLGYGREWTFTIDGPLDGASAVKAWRSDGTFDASPNVPSPLDLVGGWQEGPIRTVTRREIVPGTYGPITVSERLGKNQNPYVGMETRNWSADELRSAAMIFSQLAEFLDENKGDRE